MATVGELLILLGVNNAPLTAGLAKSEAELKGFSAAAGGHASSSAAALGAVRLAALGVAGGMTVFGIEATKSAAKFSETMELVHTQAGASQGEVTRMTQAILALAPAVGIGPQALAEGLFHIESAGKRGAEALNILRVAAEGARVGHANLETVTNALVAAQFSSIRGTTSMSETMGVLNAIVGAGNMRMEDLASSMSSGVLPAARTFGLSITDVGAALATMTDQGVPAEEAATRLRMTFALLGAPTAKAADQLKGIGLSSRQLADDMRGHGLLAALEDLSKHMQKAGLDATEQAQLLSHAFGGGRSAGTIETLIGSLDKMKVKYEDIGAGGKAFAADWAATQAQVAQQGNVARASIESTVDAIGSGLLPAAGQFFSFVNPMLAGLASWAAHHEKLAATIVIVTAGIAGLVALVTLLGPILAAVGTAIVLITSPLGILIGAVVALGIAWATNWNGIRDATAPILATIGGAIGSVGDLVSTVGFAIADALHQGSVAGEAFREGPFGQIGTFVHSVVSDAISALAPLSGLISNVAALFANAGPGTSPMDGALRSMREAANPLAGAMHAVGGAIDTIRGAIGPVVAGISAWISHNNILANILSAIRQGVDFVRGAIAFLGSAIGVVVGWLSNFISHLTGSSNSSHQAGTALSVVGDAVTRLASLISNVVNFIATLAGRFIDAASKAGIFKAAGDAIYVGFGLLADIIRTILDFVARLIGVWSGALTGAFNAFGTVIGAITGAFKSLADAIASVIKLAGQAVDAVAKVPGVKLGGEVVGNVGGAVGGAVGGVGGFLGGLIPHFASGGIVPGSGPQLAVVHGGETVTPAGSDGGGTTTIHRHIHLEIGGRELMEYIETELFRSASGFSSGFQAGPGITGA